jgi:hypothetical protein
LEGGVAEIALLAEKRCLTWSLAVAAMCEWSGLKRLRDEAVMPHWEAEPMMMDQRWEMIVAIVRRAEKSPKDGWRMQVRRNLAMVVVEVVQVRAVLLGGEGGKVIPNQLSLECEDQEGGIRRTGNGG